MIFTFHHSILRRRAAFTLVELMVVIAIIGILAALLVSGSVSAFKNARVKRVKAELSEYVAAIGSYKSKLGFYPPDNPADPAQHGLFYELMGVYVKGGSGASTQFSTKSDRESVLSSVAQSALGREGFANSATTVSAVASFLPSLEDRKHTTVSIAGNNLEFLTVPVEGTGGPSVANRWRYVSTNPTNNPKSFDLWAEIVVGGQTMIIGNWKSSQ